VPILVGLRVGRVRRRVLTPADGEPAIAVPRVKLEAFAAAAAGLAGADGIDAVAMRRLGKRCTTGMMTIYGYVTTKEDLSAVPADRDLTEIELPGWSATNALTAGPPTVASSVLSRVAHDQESRDRRGKPDLVSRGILITHIFDEGAIR
jgi:hypothetical protein